MSEPKVRQAKVSDLTPDERNANKGTERGLKALDHSLRQYGAGRSILLDKAGRIIAGNKTTQGAADIGLEDVIIIQTDGTKLVAVQRTDLDLNDPKARQLAIADNRVGELDLAWDIDELLASVADGVDLSAMFREDELDALLQAAHSQDEEEGDGAYSRKIEPPIYEPSNVKPSVSSLFDDTKTQALIRDIQATEGLTDEQRQFLMIAAQRHTVLHFNKIADYYAHSDETMQRLMENNALVIIDFNRAIELGFVQLTKKIAEQVKDEYGK